MLVKKIKVVNAVFRIDENGNKITPEEQKFYMILMFNNDETKTFEIFKNRQDTYEYLEQNYQTMNILTSQVMTDKHTMENCISVYSFMKGCREYKEDIIMNSELSDDELDNYAEQCGDAKEVLIEDGMDEEEK